MHIRQIAARCALGTLFIFIASTAFAQEVSLVGGAPSVQTFDTLAASGSSSTVPNGWYFTESGQNANTIFTANDGTSNSGDTYSYGSSGSSDRAFGTLQSNKLAPIIGAKLRNDTGNTLSEIVVAYTGEQWRLGATGRADRLDFQYSTNATSLTDTAATWTDGDSLDFSSPITMASVGALDGNATANRTAISASITGLSLAPSGTLWVRWVDLNISGNDDGLAIDDVSFSVDGTPPVDVAPFVVATVPGNAASDVALAATLAVTFSEPVTVSDPWYALQCTVSGTHMASVSGGPSAYTLTPSPAFAANEACTWTILAAGVVDNDGTPDHPASDTVVQFTTVDPATQPPTVVSTLPANGAVNVPIASVIYVTFSESVTTSSAFALTCDSTPMQISETGSGATRTLTPFTVLPAGKVCVFTISAAGVLDADNIALQADYSASFTVSSSTPSSYYDQVNTSSAEQLRCSLHQTIKGHTIYPYSGSNGPDQQNVWTILEIAQADPNNPGKIIDVYRNHSYTAMSDRAGTGSGLTYNREHTWPNSLGFANSNLAAYTDTHMLWLSDTSQNSSRGNKPYAYCSGCTELTTDFNNGVGGGSGTYPGNSNWYHTPDGNSGSFEVWNHRKGEVARSIFYMAIRYEGIAAEAAHDGVIPDLELTDDRSLITIRSNTAAKAYMGLLTDLLEWSTNDPPDAEEVARNDVIQSFQGNRNPFIDHPEWATRALFESSEPAVCNLNDDTIFKNGFEATP
ncbi:MAG TPA: endonuclease [Rudaea sp.]|nr:endonuclease [Rudaea sp.]